MTARATAAGDPLAGLADLPGVAEAVERARTAVDALRGHRVLRRQVERVTGESALRGARASAALAGADVSLDVLRRVVAAVPAAQPGDFGDPVVHGAMRAAAEVGALKQTWRRAPLQAIARLHTVAAAGQEAEDRLGRPETSAAQRLLALGDLLMTPTTAPALVVAAVVHGELATTCAFPVGAGVVARAAGRLTMVVRGLDPAAVTVPEVGHLELGHRTYGDALAAYRDGGEGIALWLVHCAEAVVLGAREGVAICEAIQRRA